MRYFLVLAASVLISGCFSSPVLEGESSPVSMERRLAFDEALSASSGKLIVLGGSGFMGGGCYVAVLFDGVITARVDQGEFVSINVPIGDRVIGVAADNQDKGLCSKGSYQNELPVSVEPKEVKRFRVQSEPEGFDVRPTTL
ncbi:3-isopropylmalate dehydratase [Pseudomonas citronellolis]|uniref:3-isopropylmalate dehydratase n=1 Tax=Pseudomonas citronellolis TaxID=53408 RepID=UPI0021BF6EE1|nr:3-isopropylmalate dehydratase [Pseudomonas citronellolis]UXJ55054.1 3-isopropylmalate dehydratase [Pseudomonas citronellolis]